MVEAMPSLFEPGAGVEGAGRLGGQVGEDGLLRRGSGSSARKRARGRGSSLRPERLKLPGGDAGGGQRFHALGGFGSGNRREQGHAVVEGGLHSLLLLRFHCGVGFGGPLFLASASI